MVGINGEEETAPEAVLWSSASEGKKVLVDPTRGREVAAITYQQPQDEQLHQDGKRPGWQAPLLRTWQAL